MSGIISLAATLAILLILAGAIGLIGRRRIDVRWLAIAVGLVALNDLLLTRFYGLLPRLVGVWNWEGKVMALAATLAIASLPAFGWRRSGITLRHKPGSLVPCAIVAGLYCAFFVALALHFPDNEYTPEELAFQLTMPGFEEEPFYRGILLLAFDRAIAGRIRFLGVEWGWGALLSSVLFGLAHAFGYSHGAFQFDPMTMALTGVPALLGVWLRLRSGSVLIPIIVHNFGNTILQLL